MADKDRVIELIETQAENSYCDFKINYYHETKKYDLIKDVVAFANCTLVGDKYIIFNVDNETRSLGNMTAENIPDISEINSLLREYCEPSVIIELNSFIYQESFIAYIKIPATNVDRPYMIKKEFSKRGNTWLRQGQIFIRRNADNFLANRRDLDEIYNSREQYSISIYTNEIVCEKLTINRNAQLTYRLRFSMKNDSRFNILVDNAEIQLNTKAHSINVKGLYIGDEPANMPLQMNEIKDVPYSISPYTCLQKSVFFYISELCTKQLRECIEKEDTFFVTLSMSGIDGKHIVSDKTLCSFNVNK